MGTKEQEYLKRMKALGYEPSLAGMDEDDFDYVPSWAQSRQPSEPLARDYQPVDRDFAERIFKMFGRPFDPSWKMPNMDGPEYWQGLPETMFIPNSKGSSHLPFRPEKDRIDNLTDHKMPFDPSIGSIARNGEEEYDDNHVQSWVPQDKLGDFTRTGQLVTVDENKMRSMATNGNIDRNDDGESSSHGLNFARNNGQQSLSKAAVGDDNYEGALSVPGGDFNVIFPFSPKGSIDYYFGRTGREWYHNTAASFWDKVPNIAAATIIASEPEASMAIRYIKPVISAVCEAEKRMHLNWEEVEQGKYTYADAVKQSLGPIGLKIGGEYTAKKISEAAAKAYNLSDGVRAAMEKVLGKVITRSGERITEEDK